MSSLLVLLLSLSSPGAHLSSAYSICSAAAGVAGNVFAFVLFVSPIPTFKRIIRSQSTEQFSGSPYMSALLNCLICLWYGTPIVSPGIILVFSVNFIGAIFQLVYITVFIVYADRTKKLKTLGLLLGIFGVFGAIASTSLCAFEPPGRQIFVGYLSVLSLISMFAAPLFVINLVIKTKSVEYMPFYLSLATFLMSFSFFVYGLFECDIFISVPNGIGVLLGVLQLGLYFYYSENSEDESSRRRHLIEACA